MNLGEFNFLGERILKVREHLGLKQVELAQALAMTVKTVRGWEKRRVLPTLPDVLAISRALGVPFEELVKLPHQREDIAPERLALRALVEQLDLEHVRALLAVAKVLRQSGQHSPSAPGSAR